MRLLRALAFAEMTWNPLSFAGDSKKQVERQHALSPQSSAHATLTVAAKCLAVLATTFMGTQHPTIVAAVLLALGVALLALTLRAPPYFGDLSQKPKSESSKNQMWVLRSLPNRLRCSADSALVWIYLCTFLACAAQGTDSDMMLLVLPACVVLWLLAGYWLPSALDRQASGGKVAPEP
jgi:hypothetical protein